MVPWKRVGPALLGNEAKANLRVVRLQQDSDVIQGEIDGVCRPIVTALGLKHRGTAHFMLPGWLVLLFSLATPSCPWRMPRFWLTCRHIMERVLQVRGEVRLGSGIEGMRALGFALQAVEVKRRTADR